VVTGVCLLHLRNHRQDDADLAQSQDGQQEPIAAAGLPVHLAALIQPEGCQAGLVKGHLQVARSESDLNGGYTGLTPQAFSEKMRAAARATEFDVWALHADHITIKKGDAAEIDGTKQLIDAQVNAGDETPHQGAEADGGDAGGGDGGGPSMGS